MLRQARNVRVGHTVTYPGATAPLTVAVVQHQPQGLVRIIGASGDALEIAPTEPLTVIGGLV